MSWNSWWGCGALQETSTVTHTHCIDKFAFACVHCIHVQDETFYVHCFAIFVRRDAAARKLSILVKIAITTLRPHRHRIKLLFHVWLVHTYRGPSEPLTYPLILANFPPYPCLSIIFLGVEFPSFLVIFNFSGWFLRETAFPDISAWEISFRH